MPGPVSGIVGDRDEPTQLPQTQVNEEYLAKEKSRARFAKSDEFKELKEYMESRITFFQTYLPNGEPAATQSSEDTEVNWKVANLVIGEFRAALRNYTQAADAVDNS